jgi:hypothetical protein
MTEGCVRESAGSDSGTGQGCVRDETGRVRVERARRAKGVKREISASYAAIGPITKPVFRPSSRLTHRLGGI